MHSSLSVWFARTACVQDDSRQFAANRSKNLHSVGSVLSGIRTGAARFDNDRRAYRSVRGSLSGTLNAGAIHPAFPQEAPAATPVRSTTVTETPRSCRNHAVDNPTMPAPTTIADRGRIRWMSAIKNLPSDAVVVHGGADTRSLPSTLLRPAPTHPRSPTPRASADPLPAFPVQISSRPRLPAARPR